jgi:type I restriction enzyme R subunit
MTHQSEAALEKNVITRLCENGYSRVFLKDTNDLENNFRKQLEEHNNVTLTDDEFKRIRNHLDGGSIFVKARKLRDKYELIRDDGIVYIEFINTRDWCKNIFQVTNQVTNREGRYVNRYDVTLLINGLPLVQVELKRRGMEIKEAFNQVYRYKKDSLNVGLFTYIQLFVISNGVNTKYFCNNKSLNSKQLFFWTDIDNKRYSQLEQFADVFLEPCHLAKMITRYIVLNYTNAFLLVLRPYQFYAAEAILKKAEGSVENGYIWHTTGSGKTLTSFKTSQLLTESDMVDKIIFVVDRKDLDYQTTKEFNHFSEGSVTGTANTWSLVRQLSQENKLVITTIQKLTNAVKKDKHRPAMKLVKDKRVVFIFDECHRSQFGEMHQLITQFFTNHQCFGFTGTPILAENTADGRTTTTLFGKCIHKYVIKDAIDDGNVLGFSVDYLSTFHKKDETIEDEEVEGIDREEVYESPERLKLVIDKILEFHNKKTFNREFNAIFAVSSIATLIEYYELFKQMDHNLRIATIFTFGMNEDPEEGRGESSRDKLEEFMQDYNRNFGTNFTTKSEGNHKWRGSANDFNAYYIDVAKKVKEKKIDLLLVVSMFLTGFDSVHLNTLYVDKNLQYHGLVQAFSRTNRVYNEKKKHGNIVCFRNLKDHTDIAIRLFSDENALDVVLVKPYEEYLRQFKGLIEALVSRYPDMPSIDALQGEEAHKSFIELFRNILRLKTRLTTFYQFGFDDTPIDEKTFEDYTSKYKDLYERHKDGGIDKVSILEDIDFEIELLKRDDINVDYILALLKNLEPHTPGFDKEKQSLLDILDHSIELKSKKELIERFMNEVLVDSQDIIGDFEVFISKEKAKELKHFSEVENLDYEKILTFISEYEFTGRLDETILEESFKEKMGLLKRRAKKKDLLVNIKEFIDRFSF